AGRGFQGLQPQRRGSVRLRLLLPRRRGRAGLGRLRLLWLLAALLLLPAALISNGCGASHGSRSTANPRSSVAPAVPAPAAPAGPAFGLTEDNADLLWNPGALAGSEATAAGSASFQTARRELTALHPSYVRLLVNWAALQPDAARAAGLEARVSGCARTVGPCGPYAGIREQLAAIASQQRAAALAGRPGFQVVIQIFGAPAWAARAPSGCELDGTSAFSRPLDDRAIAGYRALIGSLL